MRLIAKRGDGSEYRYCIAINIYGGYEPYSDIIISPRDSIYFNAILIPQYFRSAKKPHTSIELPGQYILKSKVLLGTKFYPQPARDLRLSSNEVIVVVNSAPADKQVNLVSGRTLINTFFWLGERELVTDSIRNQAYLVLNEIRKLNSYLSPYAEFVSIGMLAFDGNRNRLEEGIMQAKAFVNKYQGSILGEEIEFLLVEMIRRKEGKSVEFYREANRVIKKYPKNINAFGIKKLLGEK